MKYIASCSFGKDSLAMVLRLIEENKPLDEVVYWNNGMDFNCIYANRDKLKRLLDSKGIKFVELKPKNEFLYDMLERTICKDKPNEHKGYAWCGGTCRWGTMEKIKSIDKYCQNAIQYVGLAYDENERLKKERNSNKIFPLAQWKMTEKDCLEYCRMWGWQWLEGEIDLYDILDRVSCWCCRNKNIKELRNYYLYLPEYWRRLKELQAQITLPFKQNYSIFDLEERFKQEENQISMFKGETK